MRVALVLAVLLVVGVGSWLWLAGGRKTTRTTGDELKQASVALVELTTPSVVQREAPAEPEALSLAPFAPLEHAPAAMPVLHSTRGTLVVHGRVLDEDGAALEDDSPAVGLVDGRGETREVAADARGVFSFAGLVPGAWTLQVDAVGFRTHVEEFLLDDGNAPLAREIRLTRLPRLVVRAVTPAGEPLVKALRGEPGFGLLRYELTARAATSAMSARPESPSGAAFSWSLARHCATSPSSACLANRLELSSFWPAVGPSARELGPDALGLLDLEREQALFVELLRGAEVLARERVAAGQREVRFELEPAALRAHASALTLRALDATTRLPLAGSVTLQRPFFDALEFPLDAEGNLTTSALPSGPQELRVLADGHEILRRTLTLPAGDTLALGELFLAPAVELRIDVHDATGQPYRGRFALAPLEPTGPFFSDELTSSAEGHLAFDGLRAGRYLLRTTDEGPEADGPRWALAPTELLVTNAGTSPVHLQLEVAAELVLLGTRALPWRTTARVSAGPLTLFEATLVPSWLPRFVLAPGPHRVELIAADGRSLATREIVLQEGENELFMAP